MRKAILFLALMTCMFTVQLDAQSKSSTLNNGGKAKGKSSSSSVSNKKTANPTSTSGTSSRIGNHSKPKSNYNRTQTSDRPLRNYRKDEDYTHGSSSNSENTSGSDAITPTSVNPTYSNTAFTVGPNYQKETDYNYMARYSNTVFARRFQSLNAVFPRVNSSADFKYTLTAKTMALTNTTSDTLIVDVFFSGIYYAPTSLIHSRGVNTHFKTIKLLPGEMAYINQYRQQYSMKVYANRRSEETLVNEYVGNCSPVNIYLSLTSDLPK